MPPVLLNSLELADHFGCSPATIKKWAKDGKIPFIRDERKRIFYNLPAVVASLRPNRALQKSRVLKVAAHE